LEGFLLRSPPELHSVTTIPANCSKKFYISLTFAAIWRKNGSIEYIKESKSVTVSDCRAHFVFWIEKFSPALGDALQATAEANQLKR
jgi:hypothetical protein